jgi:hypothetical protein
MRKLWAFFIIACNGLKPLQNDLRDAAKFDALSLVNAGLDMFLSAILKGEGKLL